MALQKFDDLWFRTVLSEQAESRGIQYLEKNHSEYLEMRTQTVNLVEQCPALEQFFDCEKGVNLMAEEQHQEESQKTPSLTGSSSCTCKYQHL